MKRLFGLFTAYLGLLSVVFSQTIQVSGYVRDGLSGEPLIQASVSVSALRRGTLTNSSGYFSISLPAGVAVLRAGYVGYQASEMRLTITRDTALAIGLQAASTDTVEIAAQAIGRPGQLSIAEIPVWQIRQMPMLFGETDVIKAFQLMPGVQAGAEGTAGLYVRGGSPDQNLILLDDVPLYYVNHAGGFISLFDSDALGYARLIKGAFPARFGGRLSSVLDLRIKEGDKQQFHRRFTFGLLSSRLLLEGPIRKDTSSFLLSGRFSNLAPLTFAFFKAVADGQGISAWYGFYDLYAKYTRILSPNNRLFISAYTGNDGLRFRTRSTLRGDERDETTVSNGGYRWGNTMASVRWNHLYHARLFHNVTLAYTRFGYETNANSERRDNLDGNQLLGKSLFRLSSGIQDIMGKIDYDAYPGSKHQVRFGGSAIFHNFRPGIIDLRELTSDTASLDTALGGRPTYAGEFAAYFEDEIALSVRFSANIGIHLSAYLVNGRVYAAPQPRLNLNFRPNEYLSFSASYTRMQQYLHLLTRSTIGLPSDLWVPVTDRVGPQLADQWVAGASYFWPLIGCELSVEGFFKQVKGMIAYKEGSASFSGALDWQGMVETGGEGRVYGLEALIQRKSGRTTGWIGYTLSRNTVQFDQINGGKAYPFSYDRRHNVSVVCNHAFSKRFSLSAEWIYMSGRPVTLAILQFQTPTAPQGPDNLQYVRAEYYGGKNEFRLPDYHRLDVSLQWHKKIKRSERTVSLGVYNLYNRQNPFFYFYRREEGQSTPTLFQFTLFPVLPSISGSWAF